MLNIYSFLYFKFPSILFLSNEEISWNFFFFFWQHMTLGKNNGLIILEKIRIVATFTNILKKENVQKRSIKIYFPWGNIISACMINLQHLKDSLKLILNFFMWSIPFYCSEFYAVKQINGWYISLFHLCDKASDRKDEERWNVHEKTDVQKRIVLYTNTILFRFEKTAILDFFFLFECFLNTSGMPNKWFN